MTDSIDIEKQRAVLLESLRVAKNEIDELAITTEFLLGAGIKAYNLASEIREWVRTGKAVKTQVRELIQVNAALIMEELAESALDKRFAARGRTALFRDFIEKIAHYRPTYCLTDAIYLCSQCGSKWGRDEPEFHYQECLIERARALLK